MWPLWLIIAVAVAGSVTLTVTGVAIAVSVERRKHRKQMTQHGLDRNLSRCHRPHLSINDVDITSLPRPMRSLRQSVQSTQRDSRFYSTMPSEDEIRAFPDGSAESLADGSHIQTDVDRSHQWLSTSKSKRSKRKKKSIKLSISAPVARSPLSAVTERTELGSERHGSPEPVELPTHTTPEATPERPAEVYSAMPKRTTHIAQDSIDSVISIPSRVSKRVSQRIDNGTALRSRSISIGSITAPPPDCPLPSVPENGGRPSLTRLMSETITHARNVSELSTQSCNISLLSSPLVSPLSVRKPKDINKVGTTFSEFNFGLNGNGILTNKPKADNPSIHIREPSKTTPQCELPSYCMPRLNNDQAESDFRTIDASGWNLPNGNRRPGDRISMISQSSSRPSSILAYETFLKNNQNNPNRTTDDSTPSRPISVSSADLFRHSVIGQHVPTLESPKTKGHKRQNCVRIKNLTPADAKKRLSSQLDRLAEAESEDEVRSVGIEIPTISPAKPRKEPSPTKLVQDTTTLCIPKLRQPQALSLRMKRPGLVTRDDQVRSPTSPEEVTGILPHQRQPTFLSSDQKAGTHSKTIDLDARFVYAGSPASDPTKPPPPEEFSPISPTAASEEKLELSTEYSSASPSPLYTTGPRIRASTSPCRKKTQLHGPRNAPPPSLRTRNRTSPRLRQAQNERSGSPIRKPSASQQQQRISSQDDVRKSTALLKTLTHGASSSQGLPEFNVVSTAPSTANGFSRTPSSRYVDNPSATIQMVKSRQRSRTIAGHTHESNLSPIGKETMAEARLRKQSKELWLDTSNVNMNESGNSPGNIHIWEDKSAIGESPPIPCRSPLRKEFRTEQQQRFAQAQRQAQIHSQGAVEKDSLPKLYQNTDSVISHPIAFGHNANSTNSGNKIERKRSKLDGFWGDKGQDEVHAPMATGIRLRSGSGIVGPRKRSHTVTATTGTLHPPGLQIHKPYEGVGLGLKVGRLSPVSFVNEMERDGIGKLR